MIKDKISIQITIVAAALVVIAIGAAIFIMKKGTSEPQYQAPEALPSMPMPSKPIYEPIKVDSAKKDSTKDTIAKTDTSSRQSLLKSSSRVKPTIHDTAVIQSFQKDTSSVKTVTPREHISDHFRLQKPQRPEQIPEYLQLIYRAIRETAKSNPEKALRWIDEATEYSQDAIWYSYASLLKFRLNRNEEAQIQAEHALSLHAEFDPRATQLAKDILACISNNTSAETSTMKQYP